MSITEIINNIEQNMDEKKSESAAGKAISDALKRGNSVEIHPAKNGVRIYEVKKKIIG